MATLPNYYVHAYPQTTTAGTTTGGGKRRRRSPHHPPPARNRSGCVVSARQPRFELAHTDAGWTARFRAANGRALFSTGSQVYSRKRDALNAIAVLAEALDQWVDLDSPQVYLGMGFDSLEIRTIDERGDAK